MNLLFRGLAALTLWLAFIFGLLLYRSVKIGVPVSREVLVQAGIQYLIGVIVISLLWVGITVINSVFKVKK